MNIGSLQWQVVAAMLVGGVMAATSAASQPIGGISFPNTTGSTLSNAAITPQAGSGITTMGTADLNQDGIMDIVYGLMIDKIDARVPIRILLGNGDGTFREGTTEIIAGPVPAMNFPHRIYSADFNADGRPDLFIAGTGYDHDPTPGEMNVLLLSTPDGRLVDASSRLPRENGYTHAPAIGDINGSGTPSIYVGRYWSGPNTAPPYLLINDGRANFRRCSTECLPSDIAEQVRVGSAYTSAAFADVNGDGFPDLILGGDMDTGTRILINDGQGHFRDAPKQPPSPLFGDKATITVSIATLDIDGDGRVDLVLSQTRAAYQGRAIQILMNNGDGTVRDESTARLGSSSINPETSWSQLIHSGDINGDGFADLYAVGMLGAPGMQGGSGSAPFIWLNNGGGFFTPVDASVTNGTPVYFYGVGRTRAGGLPDLVMVSTDAQGNPAYQAYQNTSTIKPASGWWWNPGEGGRGYALEVRGDKVFFTAFMYDEGNEARWYVATGPLAAGVFEADLQRYGGPGTNFWGSTDGVVAVGSVGRIRIAFSSTNAGVMTWPGGTTPIQRFDFLARGAQRGPDTGMPESGWYVDPSQMGKGWYIEFQGRQAFVGFFTYSEGRPVWLVASGTVSGGLAPMLEAPLSLFCCGPTFSAGGTTGLYAGNAGPLSLTFRNGASASAKLPDGSNLNLIRFRF